MLDFNHLPTGIANDSMRFECVDLLDFNNASNQENPVFEKLSIEQIKVDLLLRLEDVLTYLFPEGYVKNNCFRIGSTKGNKGKSLIVQLAGEKQGSWYDFAENTGGDILSLWSEARGYHKADFAKLLSEISEWLGNPTSQKNHTTHLPQNFPQIGYYDHLGKPTAKWNYLDQDGNVIARISRYDTAKGKEFRVRDVKNNKAQAPYPRPLYNIPGIVSAKKIILVEGEKSAEALIQKGFIATTAMFGANAPLDKTDWSPLSGKEVIIWPDNDAAGLEYGKKVSEQLSKIASSVSILTPPKDKPTKWDAADAVVEGFDIQSFINSAKDTQTQIKLPSFRMNKLLEDESPMPDDLIAPRVLTPGGMLVIGGAPKVGKSDFIINLLFHLAAGESFLGLTPPRPLRIFYLQAEIDYDYLRERIKKLSLPKELQIKAAQNIAGTSRVQMILNEDGLEASYQTIKSEFTEELPDILCIDPIRNVFDGGENGSENDNSSMLFFLQQRVEKLRSMVNPKMGIILCHHTKKIKKKEVAEDPFQAFSGAGSLRGYYSSGIILHRPDEEDNKIHLFSELRNGPSLPKKIIEKVDNCWIELNPFSERLVRKDYGEKLDGERDRKSDVILNLIKSEALVGNVYTMNQFAEKFENRFGLGGDDSIGRRISILATKGYIRFNRNFSEFGPKAGRSMFGIMCVREMEYALEDGSIREILPTHFKCPNLGSLLEVEDKNFWPEIEEEYDE